MVNVINSQQLFDARLKAHDVVQEHLRQVITISSAVLAVTVTFLKDVIGPSTERIIWRPLLPISWISLSAAIAFAVYTILLLVNNLDFPNPTRRRSSFSVGTKWSVLLGIQATLATFVTGIVLLGIFAARNVDAFLRRGAGPPISALDAVSIASRRMREGGTPVQVAGVDLLNGTRKDGRNQVWHVRVETVPAQPASTASVFSVFIDAATGKSLIVRGAPKSEGKSEATRPAPASP